MFGGGRRAVVGMMLAQRLRPRLPARTAFSWCKATIIATPYCQDELLAQVARQYGMRASAADIRNNPNFKRQVCRFVGRDIRVQETCIDANAYGRRGILIA